MIEAKVIADSVCNNKRITSLQLKYHRFILPELNTHRQFSRSTASSRAIPTSKLIQRVYDDPAMPVFWGKNQAGMVAQEALDDSSLNQCKQLWLEAAQFAAERASEMAQLGLHKQTVNRVIEPYLWASTIVTATEWQNFFDLRLPQDAQPEIQQLAEAMLEAMDNSTPVKRQYHLPYIRDEEIEDTELEFSFWANISAARCARVSYWNHDQEHPDINKDIATATKLFEGKHWSPFEHQAIALPEPNIPSRNFIGWEQYRSLVDSNETLIK